MTRANAPTTASESTVVLVGGMLVLAGVIHVVVIPEHADEWVPVAIAFAAAAAAQFALALLLYSAATAARLRTAAILSLGLALVWLVSRTVGLPVGPQAGEAERVGVLDVAATAAELHVACAAWWLIRRGDPLPSWLVWSAPWILVGGVAAVMAGGHH